MIQFNANVGMLMGIFGNISIWVYRNVPSYVYGTIGLTEGFIRYSYVEILKFA